MIVAHLRTDGPIYFGNGFIRQRQMAIERSLAVDGSTHTVCISGLLPSKPSRENLNACKESQ